MRMARLVVALFLATVPGSAFAQDRAARAVENYRALSRGAIRLDDLTLQERADLAEVMRTLRAPREKRDTRQECIDREIRNEGGNPSPLARRIIDLKCSQD